jgi:large subunit ribosomal protein L3
MPKTHKPRAGSLQFWPRKRAARVLPGANWNAIDKKHKGLLGFIGYKVGMARALVRDLTADSMTKNKQIILPLTIVECPSMKILSIRFYKHDKVAKDILCEDLDKELKHKIKLPRAMKTKEILAELEPRLGEFSDIRLVVYSLARQTSIKKTPDIAEIGIGGSLGEKFNFAKEKIGKEIHINDFAAKGQIYDIRGVTKAQGFTGPVKRFGIGLRQHKSEKGVRRPGSLGPWTPSRLTYRAPLAGQQGFFTRLKYNSKVVDVNNAEKLALEFKHYGKVKSNYIAIKGSVQGPVKRQVLLTAALRETKKTKKENFDLIKIMK